VKEKKYNHAMDIAFAVPNSEYEDWYDCLKNEKQMVINALQKRIRELFTEQEYMEAISGFDTYEEGDLPPVKSPALVEKKSKRKIGRGYPWPTDEEGEAAVAAVKKDMPSEAQTRYNQRDIKKREKNEAQKER
jgi:hypothetical protein